MNDISSDSQIMRLRIVRKVLLADDIVLFDFEDGSGKGLPRFTAGAHIIVQVPNGMRRNYSLCSDPENLSTYQIAVKREAGGRGGSQSIIDDTKAGDTLYASVPGNNFELNSKAGEFIFVAGGIGITPILSMLRFLARQETSRWKLHYCTRDANRVAFRDELLQLASQASGAEVHFHHRSGGPSGALDLWSLFEKPKRNCHVYCCGPSRLMDGVRDTTGHWPRGSVHFESFGIGKVTVENRPFVVRLQKTGQLLTVPANRSILDVLRANGLTVRSSCESGTCGTCRTRLLGGVAQHRDMVLRDDEKADQIMPCVSRAESEFLILDI